MPAIKVPGQLTESIKSTAVSDGIDLSSQDFLDRRQILLSQIIRFSSNWVSDNFDNLTEEEQVVKIESLLRLVGRIHGSVT